MNDTDIKLPLSKYFDFHSHWSQGTFVAFDTETSGAYPVGDEVCEVAAVKWKNGQVIDQYQTLVQVTKPMSDFIIGIHGITNEMLVGAPPMDKIIYEFRDFIEGAMLVAHHAPFDMGFMSYEFEKHNIMPPQEPVFCSSLLSIEIFPEFENHKLQTLIDLFGVKKGTAHRALDDSKGCLEVFLNCAQKLGAEASLKDLYKAQGSVLRWNRFSIRDLERDPVLSPILKAIKNNQEVDIVYGSGTVPGQNRRIRPLGVVRNLDGDFLVTENEPGAKYKMKRYYLKRVTKSSLVI